jgi:GMP synthase-like glutamine amidotransferase
VLYIIQNDPEVPPGTLLDHISIPFQVLHPYRDGLLPQSEDISALIVLGGAMGANDDCMHPFLADLKELIRKVVRSGTPYLGVCLGGQLLSAALGARVESCRWEEIGNFQVTLTEAGGRDRLFSGIPKRFAAFQWHHDSFDIPPGGVLLAYSAACPHQAFRVGDRAWGVQFHPEVTEEIIRTWAAWDRSLSISCEELVAGFKAEEGSCQATVGQLIRNFVAVMRLTPLSNHS